MTINSSLLRSYPASDHIRNVNDINRTALKTSASAKTSTIPKSTDPGAAAEKTTPATPTYPPNNGRLNLGSTNIPNNPKTAIHPKRNRNRPLIAGCSKRMTAFLQTLKETGSICGEVWQLKWDDVDFRSRVVNITAEKKQQSTSNSLEQQATGNAQQATQRLWRQNILKTNHASRQLWKPLQFPTQTPNKQAHPPKTAKNPLPHLPLLERHHALP